MVPTGVNNNAVAIDKSLSQKRFIRIVLLAVLIGTIIRLSFILLSDFPLYDGGLFYSMVQDLQKAHFLLPTVTSYNSANLPFAYPPFSFYLVGILNQFANLELINLFRFLPFLVSVLSILAFSLLSRSMLPTYSGAGFAVLLFAILPAGFRFYITGGGITRSLGLLFAILSLYFIHDLYVSKKRFYLLPTIVFTSLTFLTHPEMGLFISYSIALFCLTYSRDRFGFIHTILIGIVTLALTSPWWSNVSLRHGSGIILSALSRGGRLPINLGSILTMDITGEVYFPVLAFVAFLGLFHCVANRKYMLPLWLLLILLIQSRGSEQESILPAAMLGGIGITNVISPLFSASRVHTTSNKNKLTIQRIFGIHTNSSLLRFLALLLMIIYASLSSMIWYRPLLTGLSFEEREAMSWIARYTPQPSHFLILTGVRGGDRSFEWFPTLAKRINASPIEGYEWIHGFPQYVENDYKLQLCTGQTSRCLDDWSNQTKITFTHIYIPKRASAPIFTPSSDYLQSEHCCQPIFNSLQQDSRYKLVFDGPGASVFERIDELYAK